MNTKSGVLPTFDRLGKPGRGVQTAARSNSDMQEIRERSRPALVTDFPHS